MTVIFHSDRSVTKDGFKATWKAVETSGMLFGLRSDKNDYPFYIIRKNQVS